MCKNKEQNRNRNKQTMKKLIVKLLFTLGLAIFPLFGFAQAEIPLVKGEDIKFEKIGIEQGLSQMTIHCIIQDRKGFLWIGTSDGLNKFDGYSITNYYYNIDDTNSLSGNSIQAILEDNSGILWIGTREGLNKFDPKTEKFTLYKNDPQDSESLSHNNVRSIFEDSLGTLWIATWGGGLNKLIPPAPDSSGSDNEVHLPGGQESPPKFIHYQHNPQDPESLSHNSVTSIIEDNSGILWIGTSPGGLNRFDRKTEKFTVYKNDPQDPQSLSNNIVRSIRENNSGILWIGTNNGLNKFDPKTEKFTVYKNDPRDPESLSHNNVR